VKDQVAMEDIAKTIDGPDLIAIGGTAAQPARNGHVLRERRAEAEDGDVFGSRHDCLADAGGAEPRRFQVHGLTVGATSGLNRIAVAATGVVAVTVEISLSRT